MSSTGISRPRDVVWTHPLGFTDVPFSCQESVVTGLRKDRGERLLHVARAARVVGRNGNQKQHLLSLQRDDADLSVTRTEKIV